VVRGAPLGLDHAPVRPRTRHREKHCDFIYILNVTSAATPTPIDRQQAIDAVAGALVPAASRVTRLVLRRATPRISRSEAGLLSALDGGPRRITELADLEGHAQPTMTLLVKRLEAKGWVARERDPGDRRVVLVSLTEAGAAALEDVRASYRAVLRDHLVAMSDDEIAVLLHATEALESLLGALQQGDAE
jgi:DNA-binding MarR family transcriptional regulator